LEDAFSEPMRVVVTGGDVVILGPDGIAATLTPAAAEESARRLAAAADEARRAPSPPVDEDG
jgi:hypothetical protein